MTDWSTKDFERAGLSFETFLRYAQANLSKEQSETFDRHFLARIEQWKGYEKMSFLDIEPAWDDVEEWIGMIEEYNEENYDDPLADVAVGELASMLWHTCAAWIADFDSESCARYARIDAIYSPGPCESADDFEEGASLEDFEACLLRNRIAYAMRLDALNAQLER